MRTTSARRSGVILFLIVVLQEALGQLLEPGVDSHQQIDDASEVSASSNGSRSSGMHRWCVASPKPAGVSCSRDRGGRGLLEHQLVLAGVHDDRVALG